MYVCVYLVCTTFKFNSMLLVADSSHLCGDKSQCPVQPAAEARVSWP